MRDFEQGATAMDSSPGRALAPSVPTPAQAMTVGGILTVASVLLVFLLLAFVLVFFQYYFNDRGGAQTASPSGRRGGVGAARNGAGRGVDPEVLRSMPVTVYRAVKGSTENGEENEGVECAVCLAELEDGEEARFLPRCSHGFHAECIDLWLGSHSTCPLCRLTVGKPDVSPPPPLGPLPPVPPEPANYAVNLPASLLLGLSGRRVAVTGVTLTSDSAPSTGTTAVLAIEIPEPAALTPRDDARSPSSAGLRSLMRMLSFGRQGAGSTSSCSCGGAGEGDSIKQSVSVTVDNSFVDAPPLPTVVGTGANRRTAG